MSDPSFRRKLNLAFLFHWFTLTSSIVYDRRCQNHEFRHVAAVTESHAVTTRTQIYTHLTTHSNTITWCDSDPTVCVWAQGLAVRQTHRQFKAHTAADISGVTLSFGYLLSVHVCLWMHVYTHTHWGVNVGCLHSHCAAINPAGYCQ